ncbi:osmoprotectant transport system permease protein [Alpinimonas psychrophila]|uniref:Osmoprotectant transport system permease protein n=1 Tax=Alpinimonas psychrophila TaxID=748908 RepID=A0A7W3JVK2_9MICO|nr:osmoprotectant transport system permease protein [Alpinimonas psychrophila]
MKKEVAAAAVAAASHKRPSRFRGNKLQWELPAISIAMLAALSIFHISRGTPDSIETVVLNWNYVGEALWSHLWLSVSAAVIAAAIAIPVGVFLTRANSKWAMTGALTVANIGQATPVIGVLVILALILGIGPGTAIIALVAFSFLPVLRNTLVGLQGVDPTLIQAARGMGMRKSQILFAIELPLAAQKIISGFRTALVFSIGAATLATFINAGGLGEAIVIGLKLNRISILLTGAVLVSALVLILDWLVGILEVAMTPRGLD